MIALLLLLLSPEIRDEITAPQDRRDGRSGEMTHPVGQPLRQKKKKGRILP
jgi:hypothetical protein